MLTQIPTFLRWLIWVLIAVILIIVVAIVVHALGGFDWNLHIGYLRFNLGVT